MERELMTWNPWSDLNQMEREFDRWLGGGQRTAGTDFPPVNIWTGEDDAVLLAELPGIDPDRLDITVKDDSVTLQGVRNPEELDAGENYVRRERGTGTFTRTFTLPFKLDPDKVSAEYRRGILEIHMPRSPEDKPKKISVSTQ